jgi:transcriptional regulator with XRE-family HTH domain
MEDPASIVHHESAPADGPDVGLKGCQVTPEQVKGARLLLGWSRMRLAFRVGVSEVSLALFEDGLRIPSVLNLSVVRAILETAGVEFIAENGGGAGVRLRKAKLGAE